MRSITTWFDKVHDRDKNAQWYYILINAFVVHTIIIFRPGKSCTSQLLNLTQYIKDGYQENMITGTAFVDLSAAYHIVNHRLLIQKLFKILQDSTLLQYYFTHL